MRGDACALPSDAIIYLWINGDAGHLSNDMVEIDIMKGPVPHNAPCGDDLAAEEDYTAVDESIRQTHIQYDHLDWAGIAEKCRVLLERTRDLRLGVIWSLAELRSGGFPAWTDTLGVLAAWIQDESIWNNLFPRKIGARILLLGEFGSEYATPGEFVFVKTISQIPLADACDPNARTLRAWEDGRRDQVMRAIQASSPGYVEKLAEEVRNSREAFRSLGLALFQRLPSDDATNRDRLQRMQQALVHSEHGVLSRLTVLLKRDPSSPDSTAGEVQLDKGVVSTPLSTPSLPAREWKIASSPDLVRTLDAIIAFYKREPSSPVPMILRRARGLVGLDFAAAVAELFGKDLLSQLGPLANSETGTAVVPPVAAKGLSLPKGNQAPATSPSSNVAAVNSSADVTAALDALGAYLERAEPSSPVVLLLRRARRLVASNFRGAIQDLFGAAALPKVDALAGEGKPKMGG